MGKGKKTTDRADRKNTSHKASDLDSALDSALDKITSGINRLNTEERLERTSAIRKIIKEIPLLTRTKRVTATGGANTRRKKNKSKRRKHASSRRRSH